MIAGETAAGLEIGSALLNSHSVALPIVPLRLLILNPSYERIFFLISLR